MHLRLQALRVVVLLMMMTMMMMMAGMDGVPVGAIERRTRCRGTRVARGKERTGMAVTRLLAATRQTTWQERLA